MRSACERREFLGPYFETSLTFFLKTVGTLLSRSYTAGGCIAGCIFGTGTNGAYVEQVGEQNDGFVPLCYSQPLPSAKIPKLAGTPVAEKGGVMVINCEWGAFNNSVGFSGPEYVVFFCIIHISLAFASSINTIRQHPRSLEHQSKVPGF